MRQREPACAVSHNRQENKLSHGCQRNQLSRICAAASIAHTWVHTYSLSIPWLHSWRRHKLEKCIQFHHNVIIVYVQQGMVRSMNWVLCHDWYGKSCMKVINYIGESCTSIVFSAWNVSTSFWKYYEKWHLLWATCRYDNQKQISLNERVIRFPTELFGEILHWQNWSTWPSVSDIHRSRS